MSLSLHRIPLAIVVVTLWAHSSAWTQGTAAKSEVSVKVVKYAGLADEVAKHKGKVVLVDFWFTT